MSDEQQTAAMLALAATIERATTDKSPRGVQRDVTDRYERFLEGLEGGDD